jgi:transcription antitermination factor NusG
VETKKHTQGQFMNWEQQNEAGIEAARRGPARQWYILRVDSQRIGRAIELLPYFNCIAFVPTEAKIVKIGSGGRKRAIERHQPLMTGYVVAGFQNPPLWWSLLNQPWIYGVLTRNGWPAVIPPAALERCYGIHHAKAASLPGAKSLKPGDTIRVKEGGFSGHEAQLLEITGNEGKFILQLLGKEHLIAMPLSGVEAA